LVRGGAFPHDAERRNIVAPPQVVQHGAPLSEVGTFVQGEEVHHSRQFAVVQIGVPARAKTRVVGIAFQGQVAVALRRFQQPSEAIHIGQREVSLRAGIEFIHQPSALPVGSFQVARFRQDRNDLRGCRDQVWIEVQTLAVRGHGLPPRLLAARAIGAMVVVAPA
jgi:hypothetical protein